LTFVSDGFVVLKSVSSIDFIPNTPRCESYPIARRPEEFLIGPENALLHVALENAFSPIARYTPIVLFGPTGVGKSHFARGMAAGFQARHPVTKTIVCPAADFARAYATAIELDSMPDFRTKYRNVDLLVIDGLQEMTAKASAQLELVYTIDELVSHERHVIVTARSCLSEFPSLAPALRSRLTAGLSVPISLPSAETRRAILRDLAEKNSVVLPTDVIDSLVHGTQQSPSPFRTVPELRSAIFELLSRREPNNDQPNLPDALQLLSSRAKETKPTLRHVTRQVARFFHLKVAELTGPSRRRASVRARGVAMYLARELTGASFQSIGRQFDRRDHTTVLHAYRRTAELLRDDADTRHAVDELIRQLRGSCQIQQEMVPEENFEIQTR